MSNYNGDILFTEEHEWIRCEKDNIYTIGITEYAAEQSGDVVMVDLIDENSKLTKGDEIGSIETVKSVSEIYTPVDCTLVYKNEELEDCPEYVNEDPYGKGWLVAVSVNVLDDFHNELMTESEYKQYLKKI